MKIERITRFGEGATADERRAFGRLLLDALDRIGIQPGEEFIVAAPEHAGDLNGASPYDPGEPDANKLGAFQRSSDTSRKAALDNYPRSGTQRETILRALVQAGEHGHTSDEIADVYEMRLYSVKPRLIELREGGWARQSGDQRPSSTGSDVDVYVATEKGREAVPARAPIS